MEGHQRVGFRGKFEFSPNLGSPLTRVQTSLLLGASLSVGSSNLSLCGSGWVIRSYRSALSFSTDNA